MVPISAHVRLEGHFACPLTAGGPRSAGRRPGIRGRLGAAARKLIVQRSSEVSYSWLKIELHLVVPASLTAVAQLADPRGARVTSSLLMSCSGHGDCMLPACCLGQFRSVPPLDSFKRRCHCNSEVKQWALLSYYCNRRFVTEVLLPFVHNIPVHTHIHTICTCRYVCFPGRHENQWRHANGRSRPARLDMN